MFNSINHQLNAKMPQTSGLLETDVMRTSNDLDKRRLVAAASCLAANGGLLQQQLALATLRNAYLPQAAFPSYPFSTLDLAVEALKAREQLSLLGLQKQAIVEASLTSATQPSIHPSKDVPLQVTKPKLFNQLQQQKTPPRRMSSSESLSSNSTTSTSSKKTTSRTSKRVKEIFPSKLHRMLLEVEAEGKENIVSFLDNGRSFMVHDVQRFGAEVLPNYFKHSRWTSFHRQLKMYGFKRIKSGPFEGGYYHELFNREKPAMSAKITRVGVAASALTAETSR